MSVRSRKTFEQLVTLPDSAIPLAEAALLMACEEYPQLEVSPYLDQLDHMADMAQDSLRAGDSPIQTVEKINTLLFETLGFRGNTDDYYDPRNSFFNDVLDRRIGIPISLSTVYLEVARRLKFPIVGVGMPGHFIVKFSNREDEFFLDPFNRGEILTREDCQRKLHDMYGDSLEFHDRLLGRVTNRQILSRMLNNLKLIYLKAQAFDKGLAIVDMMLMTNPDDCEQFRDRGLLRLQLRQFDGASKDLTQYLTSCPTAHDREEIENHLKELKRIQAMMN
jgi:regulator of sirC expression with transglutaminase-like and TPR domain